MVEPIDTPLVEVFLDPAVIAGLSWRSVANRALHQSTEDVEVLTLEEVARYLRSSLKTTYRLARSGDLPAFKVANQWRMKRADLDGWISHRTGRGRTA